jgi:hypothetical protein
MPVEHMVWVKFKEGVSAERIQEHMDNVLTMRDIIPGVVDICLGENFTDRSGGYTLGIIVTLDNRTSLENYIVCDEHVKVATPLKADSESLVVLDFEH